MGVCVGGFTVNIYILATYTHTQMKTKRYYAIISIYLFNFIIIIIIAT